MALSTEDVRRSVRTLLRDPGFATVAILSLAIAIALNTTMYSTLDALLNPKVAIRDVDRLYRFGYYGDFRRQISDATKNSIVLSAGDSFEALTGAWVRFSPALIESPHTHRNGFVVSVAPNYFSMLGVRPIAGRIFTDADVGASTPPVIIAERLARRLYPDKSAIGERVEIQGISHVVIGVLDRASDFPQSSVLAWTLPPSDVPLASLRLTIARLRDGVSIEQVEKQLNVASARIAILAGESVRDNRVAVRSLYRRQFRLGQLHIALISAVIAVLLVSCANLANLQLARGIARSRELATRAALGASRRDIIKHLVMESALLAAAGLAVGLVLTFWAMHMMRATIPDSIGDYIVEPQTSWRLFAFAAFATVVCLLLVGLAPAIRVSRLDLNELMKRGAGTGSTRAARRQYGLLIVTEIGFALVLLCGATLLVRAARQSTAFSSLWDRSMLSGGLVRVQPPLGTTWAFGDVATELVARTRAIPDVKDAAVSMIHGVPDDEITATDPGGKKHVVPTPMWGYHVVTPSFNRAMGFSIAHGRDFFEGEQGPVVIVDPGMARRLWPNTNAIGHMIKFGSPNTPGRWYRVIGVRAPVGIESEQAAAGAKGGAFVLAMPDDRLKGAARPWGSNPSLEIVIRATRNPHRIPVVFGQALAGDTRFVPFALGTFEERDGTNQQRDSRNFVATLFTVFAVLAVVLASLGVYGIVSHSVAERRREMGVRIALGSGARGVLHAVLREGNVFCLAGIAFGLLLIRLTADLVRQFLAYPEGDPYSIELYVPAAIFVFVLAVASALVPAIRATRIDPVESLRCE